MSFLIRPAKRTSAMPLIGVYGQSGCGKTMSSLLMARGVAGPEGKVVLIDTERGRGELYSDVIPGVYQVLPFDPPFSSARYIEAIGASLEAGADVLVIDSVSHEWDGVGGVTDVALEVERRTGRPGLHCWKDAKSGHARLVLTLLQSPIPVILCMRAKYKSRQVKNERGKTEIVRDEFTTPIQADDFLFEMTAHLEVLRDHSIDLTKVNHPGLPSCFPVKGQPVTVRTGERIAAWARGEDVGEPVKKTAREMLADELKLASIKEQLVSIERRFQPIMERAPKNVREEMRDMILLRAEEMKEIQEVLSE